MTGLIMLSQLGNNIAKKHNIGLIIFKEDLIDQSNIFWKKATWQKLLIGKHIKESKITAKNICFLDSDIFNKLF